MIFISMHLEIHARQLRVIAKISLCQPGEKYALLKIRGNIISMSITNPQNISKKTIISCFIGGAGGNSS